MRAPRTRAKEKRLSKIEPVTLDNETQFAVVSWKDGAFRRAHDAMDWPGLTHWRELPEPPEGHE